MHDDLSRMFIVFIAVAVVVLVGLEIGCQGSDESNEDRAEKNESPPTPSEDPSVGEEGIPHAAKRGKPKRCALLVGIDRYADGPNKKAHRWGSLSGAKNDVEALRKVLSKSYDFEVAVLTDRDATFKGIKRAFQEKLIDCVRGPGDVAFFHYSGHGQQITDDNGDELDGRDESLVPFDNRGMRDGTNNVRDDHMEAWLAKLRAKKSEVLLSFDSCNSGTMSRGGTDESADTVPEGEDTVRGGPPQEPVKTRGSGGRAAQGKLMPWGAQGSKGRKGFVMITAADSKQSAYETGCGPGGKGCMGRYTAALVRALRSNRRGTVTYGQLHSALLSNIHAQGNKQTPQLHGDQKRALFAKWTPRCRRHGFTVRETSNRRSVILEAGEAHGLQKGTILAVYPWNSRLNSSTPAQAHIRVTNVYATHSKATVLDPPADGKKASFRKARIAVVDYAHSDSPLKARLRIEADVPGLSAMLQRWHYQAVSRGDAEMVVKSGEGKKVVLLDRGGKTLWTGYSSAVTSLADRVQQHFKSRALTGLKGGALNVDVTLLKQKLRHLEWTDKDITGGEPKGSPQKAKSFAHCRPGNSQCELIELSIKNRENYPIYVTALLAGPKGSTELKFPGDQQDKVEIKPGEKSEGLYAYSDKRGAHKFHIFLTRDKLEKEALATYEHDPKAPKCKPPPESPPGTRGGSVMFGAMARKARWEVRTLDYTVR